MSRYAKHSDGPHRRFARRWAALVVCATLAHISIAGAEEAPALRCRGAEQPLICQDGWCWLNPRPHGVDLSAIALSETGGTWAVGRNGLITSWDGCVWRQLPAPLVEHLWSVWAAAPDDLWVIGDASTVSSPRNRANRSSFWKRSPRRSRGRGSTSSFTPECSTQTLGCAAL